MDLGPNPDFNWSQTRLKALEECRRRYYYQTYGSWEGWLDDADSESRLAYRLKQLSALDMAFGNIVHRFAYELAEISRAGREPPSIATLERQARDHLNERSQVSREEFIADPKNEKMLHGSYYRDGPDERAVERVNDKLNNCVANLHDLDVWRRIRHGNVRVVRANNPFGDFVPPSLEVDGVGVYAIPDLIVFDEAEDTYIIFEWKTGRPHASDRTQMGLYGLFAERNLTGPPAASSTGRLVYLQDGSHETVDFSDELIADALDEIRDGIDRMRDFVDPSSDEDENAPVSKDKFQLTDNRWNCRSCNFFELCEEELRRRGPLPWEETDAPVR